MVNHNCKIDAHEPTEDGSACSCGYFAKARPSAPSVTMGGDLDSLIEELECAAILDHEARGLDAEPARSRLIAAREALSAALSKLEGK